MTVLDIRFNSKTEQVELVYPNGKTEVLADHSPTKPQKSPDNKKAVYISPLEWEARGSLYLVDLKSGEQDVLVTPEGDFIPKNVIWQDDSRILVIIGYGHGTVSVGGNIYSVNIKTKEKVQITQYDGHIQILDLEIIENDVLNYRGIKYKDEELNESEVYSNNISLNSLMSY
ncbi:DUF4652 domain-containing protein [Alkalihalobacillus sp. MEB130]|uniref:DUF4652 domain-containing protein n=1 Tax=Alkalihalobacillus sp. MEB130 TaxID=2976704 RepID=UPI0028E05686|nr:DUF4652 domain-containing protein [Alkalihalobacillus sp. MEB130]MDT8861873.1 DUF4652 domain-containing protein [Alkalihalobacillus sp. MEB130]